MGGSSAGSTSQLRVSELISTDGETDGEDDYSGEVEDELDTDQQKDQYRPAAGRGPTVNSRRRCAAHTYIQEWNQVTAVTHIIIFSRFVPPKVLIIENLLLNVFYQEFISNISNKYYQGRDMKRIFYALLHFSNISGQLDPNGTEGLKK